ncbi:outer membrane beta-barrel family protein [Chitinophaga sp. S165]|uniref:outer membrane beta-barrel family protein n=1 Tax=Chitinophaga sp. S165 TaxID=2135462 RepID=UPI000D70B0C9|nr:outer membrane beta-barrel family protein [Chitinophaga sp. S165]PWV44510.1 outer membrane receptor protein involved in Fe transport [Chitinophaga sp. S165]
MNTVYYRERIFFLLRVLLCLSPLLCNSFNIFSQSNNFSITGRIVDAAGVPVEGASVTLLSAKDSSVILAGRAFGGQLKLDVTKYQPVILKISAVGLSSFDTLINNTPFRPVVDLGTIKLHTDTKALREVEITARQQAFKVVDGNMSINVDNTLLSASNSVSELLSKTPGLSMKDDAVAVVGKGDAIVFYNGERIPAERLQSLQVSQIKQIEIITNPSTKYDAEGKAVINIIGKKKMEDGLLGRVRQNISQGKFFSSATDLSLDYKFNKFAISTGFNFQTGTSDVQRDSRYNVTDTAGYIRNTLYNSRTHSKYIPTYRVGINYHIDSLSTFSIEYNGNKTVQDKRIDNQNRTQYLKIPTPVAYSSVNNSEVDLGSNTVSANYNRTLDPKGSNLFVGAQYFRQIYKYDSDIHQTDSGNVSSHFNNTWYNRIRLISVRTDLEKVFDKNNKLTTGVKFAQASTVSDIKFSEEHGGEWVNVDDLSRKFRFSENVPAAYLEFGHKFDAYRLNAGVRTEMSIVRGYSGADRQKVIDTNYVNLFPFVKVSRKKGKYEYTLSYATRLHRPSYDDLDPFTEYHDPTEVVKGNPYLRPSYTHSLEVSLSFDDYLFKVGYMRTKNDISPFLPNYLDSGRIEIQKVNLNISNAAYLGVTVPLKTTYWEAQTTFNVSYSKLNDKRFSQLKDEAFPLFYISSYHTFYIPHVFNVELLGEYNSRQSNGFITNYHTIWTEMAISRKFLHNKLNARLSANDVINAFYQSGRNAYANRENYYERRFSARLVRLSLTYSFGKLKSVDYKNVGAAKEEINRAH